MAKKHEQIHKQALAIATALKTSQMAGCKIIFRAQKEEVWKYVRGPRGRRYVSEEDYFRDVFNISPTAVFQRSRTWEVFGKLKFNKKKVLPMRHMFLLSYVVTQNSVTRWLDRCRSANVDQVGKLVRKECGGRLGDRGRKVITRTMFTANVTIDENIMIEDALVNIMKSGDAATRGEALAFLASLMSLSRAA